MSVDPYRKHEGLPALDYQFTGTRKKTTIYGRSLYVFERNRLYQVDFTSRLKSDLDSEDVHRYFASFHIEKRKS